MAKLKNKKIYIKIILFIILVSTIIFAGIKIYKTYLYHQTYEYKFLQANYTIEDYNMVKDKLNDEQLNYIIALEYNENIPKLVHEKYFIYKNLGRYITYLSKNQNKSLRDIISLVNVNRDRDFYEGVDVTDASKGTSMLVNKYHALAKDYEASDIVKVSPTYAYEGMNLNKEAYDAFKRLADDAKKEGYTIVILSSYRTFTSQEDTWKRNGDKIAARPGSSEHETGYAIDVADYNHPMNFKDQEAYQWMLNNSYKYGYILRYPEGKEDITGYDYESWHYRYLGVDLATKVYNEGITFDEYYEFYLNN